MRTGLISKLKFALTSDSSRPPTIPLGLYKGLRLDINMRNQSQLFVGLWERETHNIIRQALHQAEWYVDIGAGIGELVLLFSRSQHLRTMIAIEPSRANVQAMLANFALNGLDRDRVEVIEKLAGTNVADDYVSLDTLDVNRKAPGFLKIDVDGAELDVLRSGARLLTEGNIELLLETHSLELERDCTRFLTELGYTCRIVNSAWWRHLIPEQRPIAHNRWLVAAKHHAPHRPAA